MTEPNYAVAPGEYLEEWIDDRGLSRQHVAELLGISLKQVNEIINGHAQITDDLAIRLEIVVGVPFDSWLRLEAFYRSDLARIANEKNQCATAIHITACPDIEDHARWFNEGWDEAHRQMIGGTELQEWADTTAEQVIRRLIATATANTLAGISECDRATRNVVNEIVHIHIDPRVIAHEITDALLADVNLEPEEGR